jgi:hypothetical protein
VADTRGKQLEQLKQLCLEAEQLRDAALRLCADLGEQLELSRSNVSEHHPDTKIERRRIHERRHTTHERRRPTERRRGSRRTATS